MTRRILVLTTILLTSGAGSSVAAASRQPLTLADRLDCRIAIEEIYWRARIWPAENPGQKPSLPTVVSKDALAAQVEESLARSVALVEQWQAPITGAMLQAELERIARSSRRPSLLAEIYAALDHQPARVAECLARPLLAERLLQERFHADPRLAGTEFTAWWTANRPLPASFSAPDHAYTLPAPRALTVPADSWRDTASLPLDHIYGEVEGAAVWTGSEMVFLGDFDREAYRYDPTTDSWKTASTLGGPLGLRDTTAVWTGQYVVASNGCTANNHNCATSLAWRYDPLIDLWEQIPNAPIGRTDQSAVWTGSEMIVWGGCTFAQDQCQVYSTVGARYDPVANTWEAMSSAGAPQGRTFPNLVWTGNEVIVWGGRSGNASSGGRYHPASDSWSGLSADGAPTGPYSVAVWADTEMIAWGGCSGSPSCSASASGARYDPATDSWAAIATAGAPGARFAHTAVWTGEEMIVWGGYDGANLLADGARYEPLTNSWSPIAGAAAPAARRDHHMLWTGSRALVWGGSGGPGGSGSADMRTGGRYDPIGDSWEPVGGGDPHSLRTYHSAVWTGAEMIVWGGVGDGTANSGLSSGRRYDPATDSWSPTTLSGAPPGAWDATAVWTGTRMIVWGGQSGTLVRDTGGLYDPVADAWSPMATTEGRTENAFAWTGNELVVWGGGTWTSAWTDGGARYNPATDTWTPIAAEGAPSPRAHPGRGGFTWSGEELLVWGGFGPTGEVASGSRYRPGTDTWTPMSEVGAPSPRYGHVTVWSGDEMIVWGGAEYSPDVVLGTGARYNPATDNWTTMSTAGTPLPALYATGIWSGSELLLWGGACAASGQPTCHTDSYEGGRYDPVTDIWSPTSLDGVPEARRHHTAVWTGEAMIVWGGIGTWSGYRHTGGAYFPYGSPAEEPICFVDGFEMGDTSAWSATSP